MASLALQHMLMQSWNGRPIAIFPAVPTSWADVQFARLRAEGAVLVSGVRSNGTTIWFSLNATKGGNVTVHSTITDLATTSSNIQLLPQSPANSGIYEIVVNGQQPWTGMFYSQARGQPSSRELRLTPLPLPADQMNLWGTRRVKQPLPPPAPPSPPLHHCPKSGCSGCGGCHWPYLNSTEPDPSRPFSSTKVNLTTLQCEARCSSLGPPNDVFATNDSNSSADAPVAGSRRIGNGCVGFTRRENTCWFYERVSGRFSHNTASVSWHPRP